MIISFGGRKWRWNQEDTKLLQVNDWIKDLSYALDVCADPAGGVAIQAGGAMGIWPWAMGDRFDAVYTFEPHPDNYACLRENVLDSPNIIPVHGALSARDGFCEVKLPKQEHGNAGAYYIKQAEKGIPSPAAQKVPVFSIDTLVGCGDIVGRIALIQLDIEGLELKALIGGANTIVRDRPVIMVEDKPLPQDKETGHVFGAVERWLVNEMDYVLHKRVHRDLIFIPKEQECPIYQKD